MRSRARARLVIDHRDPALQPDWADVPDPTEPTKREARVATIADALVPRSAASSRPMRWRERRGRLAVFFAQPVGPLRDG